MREYSAAERAAMAAAKLAAGQTLSARDLAQHAACSERTARRTLIVLSLFFPLHSEGGRYNLRPPQKDKD